MLPYRRGKLLSSSSAPLVRPREEEPLAMPRVLAAMKRQRFGLNALTISAYSSSDVSSMAVSSVSSPLSSSLPPPPAQTGFEQVEPVENSQNDKPGSDVGVADMSSVDLVNADIEGIGGGFAATIPAQLRFEPVEPAPLVAVSDNPGNPGNVTRRPMRVRPLTFRLSLAAIVGTAVFIGVRQNAGEGLRPSPVVGQIDALAQLAGFGINQVSLKGHRYTPDGDIFDALELGKHRSMLSFSITAARARLEALPWIDKANVLRELPDQLVVEVSEREAFAVWRSAGKHQLIDATGRVLTLIKPDGADHLPLIIGAGGARPAKAMLDAIAAYPKIAKRLVAIERVGGRRWTLWFAGGPRADLAVHLPQDDERTALARLSRLNTSDGVLNKALAAIDLRLPHQLTLRRVPTGRPGHARSNKQGSSGRS